MPVIHLNLTHQVVHELGRAILRGDFDGKSFPTEAELCGMFSVSRTAMREAVKMLTAKGLISSRPRQGIRVLDKKDWNMFDTDVLDWILAGTPNLYTLRHFLQLRLSIEPQAAFLAAQFATPENINQIEAALGRMRSATDGQDDTLEADIEFHKSVMEATNNPFFIQLKHFIETALRVNIRFTDRREAVTIEEYEAHQNIVDAIKQGNSQLAWDYAMKTQDATMTSVNLQIEQAERHNL